LHHIKNRAVPLLGGGWAESPNNIYKCRVA